MIPVQKIVKALAGQKLPAGPLVAALPMYDWPERRDEVDAEWAELRNALRASGIAAPERLARCNADLPAVPGGIKDGSGRVLAPDPATLPPHEFDFEALWQHPSLLFAQTCWGPMELWLGEAVQVIGQDDYSGIEGGEGEYYSSAIVMRPSISPPVGGERRFREAKAIDPVNRLQAANARSHATRRQPAQPTEGGASLQTLLSGLRLAYNVADSMSGYMSLERDLQAQGSSLAVFSERIVSGGHRNSIRMVASGAADVATVDCKTWALALQYEPAAKELAVIGWTAKRKGLPFITARR
jgi:ABC-type phosphate/phosphonate transport system substrate-binding protein